MGRQKSNCRREHRQEKHASEDPAEETEVGRNQGVALKKDYKSVEGGGEAEERPS